MPLYFGLLKLRFEFDYIEQDHKKMLSQNVKMLGSMQLLKVIRAESRSSLLDVKIFGYLHF